MFTRSTDGLNNLHIFWEADYIAYAEGGDLDDRDPRPIENSGTNDEAFWDGLFRALRPDLKVKVFLYGSATNLEPIANRVREGELTGIIVCMDSDYREYTGSKIFDARVIYTHGYSWENDVLNWEELRRIALDSYPWSPEQLGYEERHAKLMRNFGAIGKRLAKLDITYAAAGSGIKLRRQLNHLVRIDADGYPALCRKTIIERLRELRGTVSPVNLDLASISFWTAFHGHTIEYIICEWLHRSFPRPKRRPSIRKDQLMLRLIRRFHELVAAAGDEICRHYRQALAALPR